MVAACIARFGRIDVLVNNVGGSAKGGPVEMSEEVWDAQLDHNLKSVFLTCKHVLPHMLAQGGGAIVNLASTSGLRWTGSAQIAYASTKAGGDPVLARAGRAVRGPGHSRQHRGARAVAHADGRDAAGRQRAGGDVQALLKQRQSRIPLPFMGDGRDTAAAALFLASTKRASSPAPSIVVDGGMSCRAATL
jgi:NAD(P)-dependent dehydrogenase (short-subunit alcohol dehydrogenase family)